MKQCRNKQQGIALITILVMVALATILASTIARKQLNTTENTYYLVRQTQTLQYAKSAESFLIELLVDDAKNAGDVDHLQETWAKPMPVFPVDGGTVSASLEDESGKFNLNSLVKEDGTVNEAAKKLFEQLLVRVDLPEKNSEAVIDWQDEDDTSIGSMGAESSYYQGLQNGYLASNQPFFNIEELKKVRGFEGENFKKIEPYVSVNTNRESKININTASAFLLASMDPNLDVASIQNILEVRKNNLEHFEDAASLWELSEFQNISDENKTLFVELLGVTSNAFKAKIEVEFDGKKRQFTSYIIREKESVYITNRSLAPF
jgi:general secretion pathway protein K